MLTTCILSTNIDIGYYLLIAYSVYCPIYFINITCLIITVTIYRKHSWYPDFMQKKKTNSLSKKNKKSLLATKMRKYLLGIFYAVWNSEQRALKESHHFYGVFTKNV